MRKLKKAVWLGGVAFSHTNKTKKVRPRRGNVTADLKMEAVVRTESKMRTMEYMENS